MHLTYTALCCKGNHISLLILVTLIIISFSQIVESRFSTSEINNNEKHLRQLSSSCKNAKLSFRVEIKTDSSPQDLQWHLYKHSTNREVMSGKDYIKSHTVINKSKCLEEGAYRFLLYDLSGNGLASGSYYKLYVNDEVVESYESSATSQPFFSKENIISYCTSDDSCVDRNTCTMDYCSTATNKCIFSYITEPSFACRSFGTGYGLAIRVTANDAEPTGSLTEISNAFFGTYGSNFSLSSQVATCSYDKFHLLPFSGITSSGVNILNGIIDIHIATEVIGANNLDIVPRITSTAKNKLGQLKGQFHYLFLCVPHGTLIGNSSVWEAYAYVDSYISIYNDQNCLYPSVMMHEFGHNLGLSHSNDNENYGDESGMMGLSSGTTYGPLKCYNGPKSWELGWYSDTNKLLDATVMQRGVAYNFTLIGFSLYEKSEGRFTILKIVNSNNGKDYFVSFNFQDGINSGSVEGKNKVLIAYRATENFYDDTNLYLRLAEKEISTIYNFNEEESLTFSVISISKQLGEAKIQILKDLPSCETDNHCILYENSCMSAVCTDNKCQYENLECSSCGSPVSVHVTTNIAPEKIGWDLINIETDAVLMSSGYYSQPDTVYINEKCVEYGKYLFSFAYTRDNYVSYPVELELFVGNTLISKGEFHNETYTESTFIICNDDSNCVDFDGCSIDHCNLESNLCNNTATTECLNCTMTSINITSDNYPDEISWSLHQGVKNNNLVLYGEPFATYITHQNGRRSKPTKYGRRSKPTRLSSSSSSYRENTLRRLDDESELELVAEEICLENNFIYLFSIFDSFGDGICCSEGNGGFSLSTDNTDIISGGEFGESESVTFSLGNCTHHSDCHVDDGCIYGKCIVEASVCIYGTKSCSTCGQEFKIELTTAQRVNDITWKVVELNKHTAATGDGGYMFPFRFYRRRKCLPYGSYAFTIYSLHGVGLSECHKDGVSCGYALYQDGVLFKTGTDFTFEETTFFSVNAPTAASINNAAFNPTADPTMAPSVDPTSYPSLTPKNDQIYFPTNPKPISLSNITLALYCPLEFSGYLPTLSCTAFYHCANGIVNSEPEICKEGLMFSVELQYCTWSDEVFCSI